MCSLAHPRAALGFDATAFLDRRRGVAAVARRVMATEPAAHHIGVGAEDFSGMTPKRGRTCFDSNAVTREGLAAGEPASFAPAPGQQQQQRLQDRMKAELDALRDLHRKALLLCRGATRSNGDDDHTAKGEPPRFSDSAAGLRRRLEAPMEAPAAKRSKACPSKPAAEAMPTYQIKAPVKVKQQASAPAHAQRAAPPQEQERLVINKAMEILKRRRLEEEIARARDKCRQEVLEIERTALPDETVYPMDLEELGIDPFEFFASRTRKPAEENAIVPSLRGAATTD